MNYKETIEYLFSRLPMFSKTGASALKKDLTNTLALCESLGNPHTKFKSIHVGGTNGKGSVSHMLAAILQSAGFKTGLYTSPHLRDFRERIRINGEMISEAEVVEFTKGIKEDIELIEPSFFELTVAMAFDHFAKHQVDIAIIEVGLGGRLDSTNIINPELSIVTNIGMDHMNILGDTLALIAKEKAGIIKRGIPAVVGERHPETDPIFEEAAQLVNAPLHFATDTLSASTAVYSPTGVKLTITGSSALPQQLALDLSGTYQEKNLVTVLSAVLQLRALNFKIDNDKILQALTQVKSITGLKGRWQTLKDTPLTICDTGHNEHGIREVLKSIARTSYNKLHIVLGMVKDKDITKVLSLLPKEASYYFTMPAIERAKEARELAKEAAVFDLKGEIFSSVSEAVLAAQEQAGPEDLVFIGGSTFVVAEVV